MLSAVTVKDANPGIGRVLGSARQSAHVLVVRHQSWKLRIRNRRVGQGQVHTYLALQTVKIFKNADRSK